jgi:malate dehydrogenase (oxaloacetate-decarboxylating)(NADP+)
MQQDDTPTGMAVLRNPRLTKGTAFSEEERDRLKLRGLLPPAVCTQQTQMLRTMENLRRKENDIERYIFLQALQARNERLFYRTVLDNIEEIMPIIYTPTVGEASKQYAHIFRQAKGFYITASDRGRIRQLFDNLDHKDVHVIVVTDGERILGLGDLGANGMGIAIGKLSLYTACAGIAPQQCLPVMLDVGTNNEEVRNDPLYLGARKPRLRGDAYLELIEEFVTAVQDAFPHALLHFEDFASDNAHQLIDLYRHRTLCINDDIQGTGAVTLAGVYAACRVANIDFTELRVLFLGAGSAAVGIAQMISAALEQAGLSEQEASQRLWLVDRQGLLVKGREQFNARLQPYAHEHEPTDFIGAINAIKPQVIIGATGSPGSFTEEVVRLMGKLNERPIIFALSNPTANTECTAEQAYSWTDGRAIFASGSPFAPVQIGDNTLYPSQCNNVYVFPGVGLGALSCEATEITDGMLLAAAHALADMMDTDARNAGALYPKLTDVRAISVAVARAVFETAVEEGVAKVPVPEDIEAVIVERMYQPAY